MVRRTWVKICGVRDPATAVASVDAGADAIGLNFFPGSKRYLADLTVAKEIVERVGTRATAVGLFVNETATVIRERCRALKLRALQLHGDETPADLQQIHQAVPDVQLFWARRVTAGDLPNLDSQFRECGERNVPLAACLLDARIEGVYGGTGETLPWESIAAHRNREHWPPIILAGGLTPQNVAAAISIVRPWGVDVAGGVESAPGVKDVSLVQQFIAAVREADSAANGGAA